MRLLLRSFPRKRGSRAQRRQGLRARQWTSGLKKSVTPITLDPFREVRTPERNYGPAKLSGGVPSPRRWRGGSPANVASTCRDSGSGPHGRIVAADVEKAAPAAPRWRPAPKAGARRRSKRYTSGRSLRGSAARRDACDHRQAAVEAKQTIPHFYLTTDITIDRLIAVREEANAAAPKDRDGNPGIQALAQRLYHPCAWRWALQRVPAANAAWAGDRILRFAHSDVGVAVALDGGLIAPMHPQCRNQIASPPSLRK